MVKNLKQVAVVVVVSMVTAAVAIAGTYALTHLTPSGQVWFESHISIKNDSEFASSAAYVSGSGTDSDPYILTMDRVDFSTGKGIEISNTSAHFILRNSTIVFHDMISDCFARVGVGISIFNSTNFSVSGIVLSSSNIEMKNCSAFEFSDNPTLYLRIGFDNCSDGIVSGNGLGEMIVANCTGFVVRGNVNLSMELNDCKDTDVCENHIKNAGIILRGCARCRVYSNTVNGISFERGTVDSQISGNLIRNGTANIWGAVYLDHVENIVVDGNIIENCTLSGGIHLMYEVFNCTILRNNISNCYGGICLRGASGCSVYHNNIFSSRWSGGWDIGDQFDPDEVYGDYRGGGILDEQGWLNEWDSGYPGGGNYYFDYNGTDILGGPEQDVLGPDGIGDTPLEVYTYLPGEPAMDHYPLVEPYTG